MMKFEEARRDKIYSIHIRAESSCELIHRDGFNWSELRQFKRDYTFELFDIESFPCSTILMDACLKIEELEKFVKEKAEQAKVSKDDQVNCCIEVKVYTEKTIYSCTGDTEDKIGKALIELWEDIYGVHSPDIEYDNENQYTLRAK